MISAFAGSDLPNFYFAFCKDQFCHPERRKENILQEQFCSETGFHGSPERAGETGIEGLGIDCHLRLKFHSSKIVSCSGLLLIRALDEVLGLHDLAGGNLRETLLAIVVFKSGQAVAPISFSYFTRGHRKNCQNEARRGPRPRANRGNQRPLTPYVCAW